MTPEDRMEIAAIDLHLARLDEQMNPARVVEDLIAGNPPAQRVLDIIAEKATLRARRAVLVALP